MMQDVTVAASKRIVVGITGASGAMYAQRLVHFLVHTEVEVHLVVSPLGQRLLHDELGMEGVDLPTLAETQDSDRVALITMYNYRDVGAAIASGSFAHDGMIVIPCSANTLSAIAIGSAQNLLHRAAHVTLKERRKLILVPREAPLSLIDIRNMAAVTEAGALVLPANPGFYLLPHTVRDVVDFVVARCLDHLGVEHTMARWGEAKAKK